MASFPSRVSFTPAERHFLSRYGRPITDLHLSFVMTADDWLAISFVLGGLLLAVLVVDALTRRFTLPPEVPRKSIHVVMGLGCAAFPWIFSNPFPVWILATLATLPILAIRLIPALKSALGHVLHGIKRPSYGEILFAPAVAMVFQLSGENKILHLVPILILTLADATGAIAGTRWGKHVYTSGSGFKSIEGSAGFLSVAVLCCFIPLWLGGAAALPNAVWIALILGTLAMMAEGFSDRGFDNIVLPVGCFFVLERLLPLETPFLIGRFIVLVLLLVLVLTGSRWSSLSGAALLGSAMLGYGCAVLADWRYAIPPAAVFISHVCTTKKYDLTKNYHHRLDVVISHCIACLPWVLASSLKFISPAVGLAGISLAMATQLALLDHSTRRRTGNENQPLRSLGKGLFFAAFPGLILLGISPKILVFPLTINILTTLALFPLNARAGKSYETNHSTGLWFGKGLASLIASLPALLIP